MYYSGAMTLPLFPDMLEAEVDYVCDKIVNHMTSQI